MVNYDLLNVIIIYYCEYVLLIGTFIHFFLNSLLLATMWILAFYNTKTIFFFDSRTRVWQHLLFALRQFTLVSDIFCEAAILFYICLQRFVLESKTNSHLHQTYRFYNIQLFVFYFHSCQKTFTVWMRWECQNSRWSNCNSLG